MKAATIFSWFSNAWLWMFVGSHVADFSLSFPVYNCCLVPGYITFIWRIRICLSLPGFIIFSAQLQSAVHGYDHSRVPHNSQLPVSNFPEFYIHVSNIQLRLYGMFTSMDSLRLKDAPHLNFDGFLSFFTKCKSQKSVIFVYEVGMMRGCSWLGKCGYGHLPVRAQEFVSCLFDREI